MNKYSKWVLASVLTGGALLFAGQEHDSRLRELVDRTQSDLKAAADLEHGKEDQRKRYQDAQGHLSTFDRKLTHGKFDKGELDRSIGKIRDVLNKNVLQASTRDALSRDITDLKIARDRRDF